MSLLKLESFQGFADADKATKWTQVGASVGGFGLCALTASIGPRGGQALRLRAVASSEGSGSISEVLTQPSTSDDTLIVGIRFKDGNAFSGLTTGTNSEASTGVCCLFACRKSGSTLWWIRPNTNGTVSVMRGTSVVNTTIGSFTQGAHDYLEVKVKLHGSTGTVDVRINEDPALGFSFTGNTTNTGATSYDEVRIGYMSGVLDCVVSDMYLCDSVDNGDGWNDFMGDQRIDARLVTGAGDDADFTPSAGSNYQNVDEAAANGDTDYNASSTVGHQDSFVVEDAPVVGATITGVQIVAQGRKTDAGTAGHKALAVIGGVDYLGTERQLATTNKFYRQVMGVSPATGIAWTESEFNAMKIGYQKSA